MLRRVKVCFVAYDLGGPVVFMWGIVYGTIGEYIVVGIMSGDEEH